MEKADSYTAYRKGVVFVSSRFFSRRFSSISPSLHLFIPLARGEKESLAKACTGFLTDEICFGRQIATTCESILAKDKLWVAL